MASEAAIERLISMTAGSESAEIYIYIQAVIPQLVNNEVITLSAADVNSLKRSWSPRVESAEKKNEERGFTGLGQSAAAWDSNGAAE